MTSVSDDVALTMDDMPLGEDGLIDFRALAVGLIETVADHAMELEADELLGEGNRRNGYRERRLRTVIGEIVLRVPKLREDTYLPERVMRPYSRVDRAMVGVVWGIRQRDEHPQDREGRGRAGVRPAEPVDRLAHARLAGRRGRRAAPGRVRRRLAGAVPVVGRDLRQVPRRRLARVLEPPSPRSARSWTARGVSWASTLWTPSRTTHGGGSCSRCAVAAWRACGWSPRTRTRAFAARSWRCSTAPRGSVASCTCNAT